MSHKFPTNFQKSHDGNIFPSFPNKSQVLQNIMSNNLKQVQTSKVSEVSKSFIIFQVPKKVKIISKFSLTSRSSKLEKCV